MITLKKKRLIAGLLVGLVSCSLVGCGSYNGIKKYEAVGVVDNAYSSWHGVAGKGGGRKYYTLINYDGVEYKISGYQTYKWAKDCIGEKVPLNVDEYLKDGETVRKSVDIDYYRN